MRVPERVSEEHRVIGRYVLHGVIASGGMATVHFGKLLGEVGFSRTVAIKRLHAQFAREPEFVSMFIDEARVAARIQHRNVVPTLDVVALDGELFLVMEYIQGESLARLLRAMRERSEVIPVGIAVSIVSGLLDGLHAAHEACDERGEPLGIIHRDVSPQNVMVGADGVARVLDFGVAKAVGRLQTTRDGQLKGKLAYMSPEQLRHRPIDRRTNVYAASVVLWEALTGQRLFQADNEGALLGMVLDGEVDAPSSVNPLVPGLLDTVVLRGLATDPEDRYPTAHDMVMALERVVPPTSPREVGRWVELVARDALQYKADCVKELESISEVREYASGPKHSVPAIAVSSLPVLSGGPGSLSPTRVLGSAASPRSGRVGILVGIAAVLGLVLIAVLVLALRGSPAASPTAVSVTVPPPGAAPQTLATEPKPSAASAASAEPTPPASASTTPEVSAAELKPEPEPTPHVRRRPHVTPKRSADCSPPYTLDSQGVRIPKPQCL